MNVFDSLLPPWAPNVHPLIVHFPIALFFVAALVDFVALGVRRRFPGVRYTAVGLYVLAALGAVASFLTGRNASEEIDVPVQAMTALNAHADVALWLVWFAGIYALVRLGAAVWDRTGGFAVHAALALTGIIGIGLVQQTAERGARLVFEFGLGVAAVQPGEVEAKVPIGASPSAATLAVGTDDAWQWSAATQAFPSDAEVLSGALSGRSDSHGVVLRPDSSGVAFILLGPKIGDLEASATLDLSHFDGTASLVHHASSTVTFDFLTIEAAGSGSATLRQGRSSERQLVIFDEARVEADDLVDLRLYAVGTHFRGFLGEMQHTHGHGDALTPGRVGVRLEGTGAARILALEATPAQ